MARPVVSDLAEQFFAALGFHAEDDEANDWPLLRFCSAWVAPLEPVIEIIRERDDSPPWGILFDVDNCPAWALSFLAQYVGVVITPDMSEEQIRNEIREPTGWARGREPAIRIAAQRTLTGERRVVIRPRTPEVGIHYVRTLKSETPDEDRTRAILRAALPAWEVLDYEAYDGATYADLDAGYGKYSDADAAFVTYDDETDSGLP